MRITHQHNGGGRVDATEKHNSNLALRESFAGMATGITRPKSVRWYLDDAARGRQVGLMGKFPVVSEKIAESGGSFYFITRPLFVQAARIRKLCTSGIGNLRDALTTVSREEGEAAVPEIKLALSVNKPDATDLAAFIKEKREEIAAEERAVEIAESMLYTGPEAA